MQKKTKKNRKASRRPNPVVIRKAKKTGFRRRKNPSTKSFMSGSVSMLKFGLLALLGLLVTRQVPQFALGARNTGWLGYGSNFATAMLASFAARRTVGKDAAQAIAIGGMLYTVERVLREKFSPVGQALSLAGIGDANASASLGRINEIYSPMPVLRDRSGAPIIPREIDARAAAAASAAAAGGASRVSGLSRVSAGSRC